MRKCLVLFLLLVLPLSWTASAVAAYCKHETTASEQNHMGHHDHQHDVDSAGGATPVDPVQSGGSDPDCGVCHAGGFGALAGAINHQRVATSSPGFADCRDILARSLAERPERPQWRVLA